MELERLFYPQSIVVVGVSESANNLARAIAENLLSFKYPGALYFLGRQPGMLGGIPIVTSLEELPAGIDLAVILTPAATVPGYLDACGQHGIHYAIIESGGFGEFSEEGRALGEELVAIAHRWGMRFVGPNCIGIMNTANGICTIFVKTEPDEIKPGRVALLAQSGGVVLTCTDMLAAGGLGVSTTVSVGNKLDLKEADYVRAFLSDEATQMIILYLESVDDGRSLLELARTAEKPILVYKSNTGEASAHIAHSHTAALANDERVVDAAFRQVGILRPRTFHEMVTFAKGCAMPPVRGNRLAVFSRSGGHGIVAADLASEFGFTLPPFAPPVLEKAKPFFRAAIMDENNPLDLGTVFNFDAYAVLIEETLRTMHPDAVMLVFNYRRETNATAQQVAETLKALSWTYDTPIALCYFAEMPEIARLERELGYPVFAEVYDAMAALAAARDSYLTRQSARQGTTPEADARAVVPPDAAERARALLAQAQGRPLLIHEALALCANYGIPVAPWALAADAGAALQLADQVGYPLALKVVAPELSHKSDVGGVALNIQDGPALIAAMQAMAARLQARAPDVTPAGYLLQRMVTGGREVILGGKRDRAFGPVVLFGLGGIYVEVFNDAALRVAPITRADAADMLREPRGSRLLQGVRGELPADLGALADNLLRLSQLMLDLPDVQEVDINPLLAFSQGALAVDARIVTR